MSRFFAQSDSGSSSDEDFSTSSDNESFSDESIQQEQVTEQPKNKWLVGQGGDSDSDDDSKKVMKSAKAKRYDDMRTFCLNVTDGILEKDWLVIQNEFENLQKAVQKAAQFIKEDGLPRFYIRILCQIDDAIQKQLADKDAVKNLNSSTSKALNIMNQKLKKESKLREQEMAKFRENPIDELESADENDELEEQEELERAKVAKKVTIQDSDSDEEAPKKAPVITVANLFEKLDQILDARGKKNTDKSAQIETLVELKKVAKSPYQQVSVLNALIPARFDSVPTVSGSLSVDMWQFALEEVQSLFDLLDKHPHIIIGGNQFDEETDTAKDKKVASGVTVYVRGNLFSFADRLDDEFLKSLQSIDPHSSEYVDRLRDEPALYNILVRAFKHAQVRKEPKAVLDTMLLRRVEHLYYKPDSIIKTLEKTDLTGGELVSKYCSELLDSKIDRIRTRALLCHAFNLALLNEYVKARDMMLISNIQDTIVQHDIPTQVLYNRTLVQIGLCAFRAGLFKDSHTSLQEISSTGKIKELLAQGMYVQKNTERTAEQDRLEKARQLPFHMHINLELVECAYLVSAMLLEIPNVALNVYDSKRKVVSKNFRRMLEYNERQVFTGPPENNRDHIMAAARSMTNGDWKAAINYVHSIKVWDCLPNAATIKEMLASAIQEESLRTYVFTSASFYESFGIANLATMFGLSATRVSEIVGQMITNEHLPAKIDKEFKIVTVKKESKMSRLELLANQYSEKLNSLVETNEKLTEAKASADEKKKKNKR